MTNQKNPLGINGNEKDMRGNPKWNYFRKNVIDYQSELLYDSRGPWPTPAPGRPLSEYAEVTNLPIEETKDWSKNVSRKYLSIILTKFIPGLWDAYITSDGRYDAFDDNQFNSHITNGMYSKFISTLDHGDTELFIDQIPEVNDNPDEFVKMDFSMMEWLCNKTLPDVYAAPTIVLFKVSNPEINHKRTESNLPTYTAIAIHIYQTDDYQKKIIETADTILPPKESSQNSLEKKRWDLAKYFVIQGAVHRINMTEHGKLHFPFDSINAITKSVLPTNHPLFCLLHPHLRLSLPVNNTVLEGKYSLLSRTNWVVYSPFSAEGKYTRKLIPDAYVGRKDKPNSFPEYTFPLKPSYPNTSFGVFLKKNYAIFRDFATAVINETLASEYKNNDNTGQKRNWEFIALWAESISEWVPGFPKREDFLSEDEDLDYVSTNRAMLIDVVSLMIWNLTVAHSADHAGFARSGQRRNVFRIHVPPPLKGTHVEDNFHKKLVTRWDLFQSYLTHQLFYKPHNTVNLVDVQYDFCGHPNHLRIQELRDILIRKLKECDVSERKRDETLPRLDEVSSSIQY
ncbi:MAG: hypothetical protein K6L75_10640 [Cellvibrionaceae bacterium]